MTFAVIVALRRLLVALLLHTFRQHRGPSPPRRRLLLAALRLTSELWPAAEALQANAAGAELGVAALVFLRRMGQHVSQRLVSENTCLLTLQWNLAFLKILLHLTLVVTYSLFLALETKKSSL